jgi:CDP-paratose 2-epimerase
MKIFITGGAGFIGCNSADYFLAQGHEVTIFDNFSRVGGAANVAWLQAHHATPRLQVIRGDIRDYEALTSAIGGADAVLHLAGQVAVTLSVQNPREDFEINALGTFNLLEAVRHHCPDATVIYASTNKVFGKMDDLRIIATDTRYEYSELPHGVAETYPLDFHSPYGCSKGAGDQYMRDYARIYGLNTVVFRQSCIYGQRQFGVEDQGWVAHFIIAAVTGRSLTIYGDGRQVRDLLYIDDLVRAYEAAIANVGAARGEIFTVGGGPANALSIWTEFGPLLTRLHGAPIPVAHADWRPGDQQVFIADIRKIQAVLGWTPAVDVETGVARLYRWVAENRALF